MARTASINRTATGNLRSKTPLVQDLIAHSGDMTASGWGTSGAITSIALTSAVLDPIDNVSQVNLLDLTASAAGNGRFILSAAGFGNKTVSALIRTEAGTGNINFGIANMGDSVYPLTENWQRLIFKANSTVGAPGIFFRRSASSPALRVYIARPQLVNGTWEGPIAAPTGASILDNGNIRNPSPSVQNLALNSESITTTTFGTNTSVTTTPNAATAPDGTLTASKIEFTGATYLLQLAAANALVAGKTYTFAVAVLGGGTKANIAIVARGGISNSPLAGTVATLTPGWQTKEIKVTASVLDVGAGIFIGFENRTFAGADGLNGYFYATKAHLVGANWQAGAYAKTTDSVVNNGNPRSLSL